MNQIEATSDSFTDPMVWGPNQPPKIYYAGDGTYEITEPPWRVGDIYQSVARCIETGREHRVIWDPTGRHLRTAELVFEWDSCLLDLDPLPLESRWLEPEDNFQDAANHFEKAVKIFRLGGFEDAGLEGYRTRMAFMHAMQSAHTSLESGLVRILDELGEEKPTGEKWDADLIARASHQVKSRPAILSNETGQLADETRRFRNFARRDYDKFIPRKARDAVAAAERLALCLVGELEAFERAMDPPPDREWLDSKPVGGELL